jgi:hypothetical protein
LPFTLAADGGRRYYGVDVKQLLQISSRISGKAGAMSWWKHAFAVEPDGPAEPTPAQAALIDSLCQRVVDRGMALPAILFLESSKPLGPMAAQSLLLLQPWFELAVDRKQLSLLTKFLDRRGSFDTLCRRIEELSAVRDLRQQVQPSFTATAVKED